MKVGIIGVGFVGQAMKKIFPEAVLYDKNNPYMVTWMSPVTKKPEGRELSMKDINGCDVAFVCVPTPNKDKGALDMSIVEEVVKECTCPLIIIRSTLMPGTTERLEKEYQKNLVVCPEYVGETTAHPLLDEKTRPFLVLGGTPENRRKALEVFQSVYNANITVRQVTATEAEVIKLSENRAIAFKVAQAQELYDACEKANIDYYTVREAVYGDDPRFTLWWTFIYPDKRGFNSPCIPKDIYGWAAWAESMGIDPVVTRAILERNEQYIGQ